MLAGRAGISEKRMFGGLAFLLKGKMLIGVLQENVVVRVLPADHARALKPPSIKPMDFTGHVMKGWLYATGPAVSTPAKLRVWITSGEAAIQASPTRGKRARRIRIGA